MEVSEQARPSSVPVTATQGGEIRDRWSWVEASVWTDRMLVALEGGVRGGVWFSLMDKVFSLRSLKSSLAKVVANKGAAGVDHVSVEDFASTWDRDGENLSAVLRDGSYRPSAIRRVWIPKPGSSEKRPLGIPTVRDRVVQGSLRQVLEPIFERDFADCSYGFRPGRGCKDALRVVDAHLKSGFDYVVDVDLKSYFDTIPHDRLLSRLQERVADSRVLALIGSFLKAGILADGEEVESELGAPQGAVLSPLLSNIYLNPLDHRMQGLGYAMVRYADDFVVLCRSRAEAERALGEIAAWCEAEGLVIHPVKTRVVDVRENPVEFLGYRFEYWRGKLTRWPRRKSLKKVRDSIRTKTKRTRGDSLGEIVRQLNYTLRGWYEYFKHSNPHAFANMDSWVRTRLRSILRKRDGLKGIACKTDNFRWKIDFFDKAGLFRLVRARANHQPRFG